MFHYYCVWIQLWLTKSDTAVQASRTFVWVLLISSWSKWSRPALMDGNHVLDALLVPKAHIEWEIISEVVGTLEFPTLSKTLECPVGLDQNFARQL